MRADLPALVRMLSHVAGVRDVSMTTNASLLGELARAPEGGGARAGERLSGHAPPGPRPRDRPARRAPVRPPRHRRGNRRGARAGEIQHRRHARRQRRRVDRPRRLRPRPRAPVRFIEYMPMGAARLDPHNRTVPAAEMLLRLRPRFDLVPGNAGRAVDPRPGPRNWVCRRTGARVGFITSISEQFCDTCNRMRLTAEGGLRPCLHQDAEVDLRGRPARRRNGRRRRRSVPRGRGAEMGRASHDRPGPPLQPQGDGRDRRVGRFLLQA